MSIVKELFLSFILSVGLSGILTVILINNPHTWYITAKK